MNNVYTYIYSYVKLSKYFYFLILHKYQIFSYTTFQIMLVYSVSPLNSIIGGWMKTQLKNKKTIINDRLYQEVTQNMEKLNLTQLQIGRISLDSLQITQPLTEENSELKTRISLIKNKICITFQLESRNMCMADINNMPLFWGEYQLNLSSGDHDNKSDIIDSTFKQCEHKQYLHSEDIKIFNEEQRIFLEMSFRGDYQIYAPKRENQQNPNRSFQEQIQIHEKTNTGLEK